MSENLPIANANAHDYPVWMMLILNSSPGNPLIELKLRCRLRCQIILKVTTCLLISQSSLPERWPTGWRDYWRLRWFADLPQDIFYSAGIGNKGDYLHFCMTERAYQRKNFVDTRQQLAPQIMRQAPMAGLFPIRYLRCRGGVFCLSRLRCHGSPQM